MFILHSRASKQKKKPELASNRCPLYFRVRLSYGAKVAINYSFGRIGTPPKLEGEIIKAASQIPQMYFLRQGFRLKVSLTA